jgi:hypothetical protein
MTALHCLVHVSPVDGRRKAAGIAMAIASRLPSWAAKNDAAPIIDKQSATFTSCEEAIVGGCPWLIMVFMHDGLANSAGRARPPLSSRIKMAVWVSPSCLASLALHGHASSVAGPAVVSQAKLDHVGRAGGGRSSCRQATRSCRGSMQLVTQRGVGGVAVSQCRSVASDGLDAGKAQRDERTRWPMASHDSRVQPIQGRLGAGAPRHGRTTCSFPHPVSVTTWPSTSTSFFILDPARRCELLRL